MSEDPIAGWAPRNVTRTTMVTAEDLLRELVGAIHQMESYTSADAADPAPMTSRYEEALRQAERFIGWWARR